MMVEAGEIPAICLRFASPTMISISLRCQVRYPIFSGRSMQRSKPMPSIHFVETGITTAHPITSQCRR
jgi:hypothetical protein